jgi:hypothetical protein
MRPLILSSILAGCADVAPFDPTPWPEAPPPVACAPRAAAMIGATPYTSLQDAIDDAQSLTIVTVCRGIWPGDLRYTSPGPLWLQGETGNPQDVVLDGGMLNPVLESDRGQTTQRLRVSGMTVRNGVATVPFRFPISAAGGVTLYSPDGELWLDNLIFRGNTTTYGGGAVASAASRVTIHDVTFDSNAAEQCGGAAHLAPLEGEVWIADTVFTENTSNQNCGALGIGAGDPFGFQQGGPIDVRLEGLQFAFNHADTAGAIWLDLLTTGTVSLTRSTFFHNTADTAVGAVRFQGYGGVSRQITVSDTTFLGNEAPTAAALDVVGLPLPGGTQSLTVQRTRFQEQLSGGLGAIGVGGTAEITLRRSDLGSGASDNDADIVGCGQRYGVVRSGVITPARPCP